MTITQLQYVLAVAEYKNFTAAAEKSFVTQPTLSMQIQKLEDELKIKIFDRTKKPIQLTPVGELIVKQARHIVNESDRIKDIVDQQKGHVGGLFTIGIIPTIMPTLLPMFTNTFLKKYPKINFHVREMTTEDCIKAIKEGKIDAAIAATPLENENIKERVLYFEPFVSFVPNNHRLYTKDKIEANDLSLDDILLLTDGHCFRDGVINLCKSLKNQDHERFQLESGNFETLVKLSKEGMGMTLLPYLNTYDMKEKDKENLRHFKEPIPAREVSLIYSKSQLKMQLIEALYTTIVSIIRGAIAFNNVDIISPLKK